VTPSPEALTLDASEISKLQPWRWPWWKPAPGDEATFGWMMLIHVTAIVGFILFPLPGWKIVLTAWAIYFLGGLGTTVRLHHAKSDTPEDVSSPRIGGFWWSHLRWLWQAGAAPVGKYCKELNTPGYQKWTRMQIPLFALALVMGIPVALALGWPVWATLFWLGPIRLVWALHAQCFVNSICHLRKNVPWGEGTARNLPWLGVMHAFQGEQWHQNHHDRPGSARLGWGPGQWDVGWLTIVALEKLGLAKDVRRPDFRESVDKAA
jgi:stearoyl-CoA desaturase (delta-9 desaturase)